jgi:pimeloyl-ACP methyl ester carboxylesterase
MTVQTINVPHLGGIDVAYQMPHTYDPKKPTLVFLHSFMTTSELYRPQFDNEELSALANLIAIDLLGHGQTRSKSEHFTYWDSAIMTLQALDALKVDKFFVLGTSQGGFVTARLALLAPERVSI